MLPNILHQTFSLIFQALLRVLFLTMETYFFLTHYKTVSPNDLFYFYSPNTVYIVWGVNTFFQFVLLLSTMLYVPVNKNISPSMFPRLARLGTFAGRVRIVVSRHNRNLSLWSSVVVGILLNLFTLTSVFCMHGAVLLAPLGFEWSVTLSSLLLTLIFNLTIVWYLVVLGRPASRVRGGRFLRASLCAEEFLCIYLLHLISLGIFGCCDLGTLFIGVEVVGFIFILITGVPAAEVASARSLRGGVDALVTRVSEASLTYLWTGLLSALPFLSGIVLIYFDTGTLTFDDLLPMMVWNDTLSLGFLTTDPHLVARAGGFLILLSILFKLGVAPLHSWLVRVYAGAYGHTVFLLAIVSKFFYMTILIRFVLPLLPIGDSRLSFFFIVVGLCSVAVGCYWGLQELRFTNVLAYSGILNTGLSILALGLPRPFLGSFIALLSFWIYLFLLMCFISLIAFDGSRSPGGLLHERIAARSFTSLSPLSRLLMALVIFGLIGIPPLLGFFPKFLMLLSFVLDLSPTLGGCFMVLVVVSSAMYLRLAAMVLRPLFYLFFRGPTFKYDVVYALFTWRIAWVVGVILVLFIYPGTALGFVGSLIFCVLDPRTGGTTGNFDDLGHYVYVENFVTAAISCDLGSWIGGIF